MGLDRHVVPVESFPPMFEVSCTLCHEQDKPADPGAVENSAEGTVEPAEAAEPRGLPELALPDHAESVLRHAQTAKT